MEESYLRITLPIMKETEMVIFHSLYLWNIVVLSCAASRYGDYFTGGLGSTLYVDEFELIYDPDELTDEEFELVMRGAK